MPDYLGLCMQLRRVAVSQFANYNFNSMCRFGGSYIGANENGIFVLDSGDTDNTENIEAFFELLTSDWGIIKEKNIRSIFLGYEADGRLILKIKDDDDNEREFTLPAAVGDNKQVSAKVNPGRDGKGRYWMLRIENVEGSDFSIDAISALVILLNRRP